MLDNTENYLYTRFSIETNRTYHVETRSNIARDVSIFTQGFLSKNNCLSCMWSCYKCRGSTCATATRRKSTSGGSKVGKLVEGQVVETSSNIARDASTLLGQRRGWVKWK